MSTHSPLFFSERSRASAEARAKPRAFGLDKPNNVSQPGLQKIVRVDEWKAHPPNPDDLMLDPVKQRTFGSEKWNSIFCDVLFPGQIKFLRRLKTGKVAGTAMQFESVSKFARALPAGSGEVARILSSDVLR